MPELAILHNIHKPHWRHGKKIAYSRNEKIAIAEILKIYFAYNFSTSGFVLPLPCDFAKGPNLN